MLPPAAPAHNALGRPFWSFESKWYDDFAEAEELEVMRSMFDADGIPYTEQFFPTAPADKSPTDTYSWGDHPSLTAEARN